MNVILEIDNDFPARSRLMDADTGAVIPTVGVITLGCAHGKPEAKVCIPVEVRLRDSAKESA